MEDFHSMSRRDLQALCKEHHIPANTTNSLMADRLATLFSKGHEDTRLPGPSCLKDSGGSGSSHDDGYCTRTKRKRVTFLLPEGNPELEGASDSNDPVRENSPELAAAIPAARTTRSRALRLQVDAGTAIPPSDVRSTRRGRGAEAPRHHNVDRSNANTGEEDSGNCAVDEGLVVGTRSLRRRVVNAAVDGVPRRSRKQSDPGATEEMRAAAAAAPDAVPVPAAPENSKVGGKRGSRKHRQDPVLTVDTSPRGSAPVAENVAQDEADKGVLRRSKRSHQNPEGAMAGRVASEISATEIPEVGVEVEEEGTAQILKCQRPLRRKSVKFRNEELQHGDHRGAVRNKLQRQTRNNSSKTADEESSVPTGESENCSGDTEIAKKSEKVSQGEEPLRRSKRNALKQNKLVHDILLTADGTSEGDDRKVARAILPSKLKTQTVKKGAGFARDKEKITGYLEVQENHTEVSDFDEPSKRKRRKSVKCGVAEQKICLLPVEKPGDDTNLAKNKCLRESKGQRLDKKAPKSFSISDKPSNETEALENVEDSAELPQFGELPKESKYQSSKDTSVLTKQEKIADDLVQNYDSGMSPTEPFPETGDPLEKSKTAGEPDKTGIQREVDSSKEDGKKFEFQNFKEDCHVSIGSPAVNDKAHDLCDHAQIENLSGFFPSIMKEIVEHSHTNREGSVRKSCDRKVQSSFKSSSKKKASRGYQCFEEGGGPSEDPDSTKLQEHDIDVADAKASSGLIEMQRSVESFQITEGGDGLLASSTNSLVVKDESEMCQSFSPPGLSLRNKTVGSLMSDGLNTIGFSSSDKAECCGAVEGIVMKDERLIQSMSIKDDVKVQTMNDDGKDPISIPPAGKTVYGVDKTVLEEESVVDALDVSISSPEVSPMVCSEREQQQDIVEHLGRTDVSDNVSEGQSSPDIHGLSSVSTACNQVIADRNLTLQIKPVGEEALSPPVFWEEGRCADAAKSASVSYSNFCTYIQSYDVITDDQGSESHDESLANLSMKNKSEKVPGAAIASTLLRAQSLEKECKTLCSDGMQESSFCTRNQSYVLTADDQGLLNTLAGSESHDDSLPSLLLKRGVEVPGEAVAATLLRTQSSEKECLSPGSEGLDHNDREVDFAEAEDPSDVHVISSMNTVDLELTCEVATKENIEVHFEGNVIGQSLSSTCDSGKSAALLDMTVGRRTNEEPSSGLRSNSKCDIAPSAEVVASLSARRSVSRASNPTGSRHFVGLNEGDICTQSQAPFPNNGTGVFAGHRSGPKKHAEDKCVLKEISEILTGEESSIKFSDIIQYIPEKRLSLNELEETMEARADVLDDVMLVNETAQETRNMEVEGVVSSNRSWESSLNNPIEAMVAIADAHDGMMLGNKVADQIANTQVMEGDAACNCEATFIGHKEMPLIGDFDREAELINENLLVAQDAEDGSLVTSPVKDPQLEGEYSVTMPLHAPACEKGIESADKQETERSAELLDVVAAGQRDEELSSYQGIHSELRTAASDVAVASLTIYQLVCEASNVANNRCLVDAIIVENQHVFPDNAAEEFVEDVTGPTDLVVNMSTDTEGRHALRETGEPLMENQIVCNKEFPENNKYDPTNGEETGFSDSYGTVEKQPCEVGLNKHRETGELIKDALKSEEKLGTKVAREMENTAAEVETAYQNTLDLEKEKEFTGVPLGHTHLLSTVKTPSVQDSVQTNWKGLETIDKLVEGTDPDDQCAIRTDGSNFQDGKPLHEESAILSIGPTDDANMSLCAKSPESSFVEIESDVCELVAMQPRLFSDGIDNDGYLEFKHHKLVSLVSDVNSVEILESSITKKLYPDSSRNKSSLPEKEDRVEYNSSYETCSEVLQTEKSIGGHDFVDHGENEMEDDKPNRDVSEQQLCSEEKSLKGKGHNADDKFKMGVSKGPVAVVHGVDELRGEKSEKKSSYKHQREVYEAMKLMAENDCKDHREFEQEENKPNLGLSEEKLAREAEYRCLLEQNEETLGEGFTVCFKPETLVNESWRGRFERNLEHETRNDVEEDVVIIFGELHDSKSEDASSNKHGSTSDHDYFAHIEGPAFQGLVEDIQITLMEKPDIEENLEQVQGSWDLENTVTNHEEEAGIAQDKEAVEIRTESEIHKQREDFDCLTGFDSTHYQDPKDEPTYKMTEREAMEPYSVEGCNLEEILDLEASKNAESSNGQEEYVGPESDDYCTFVPCIIGKHDPEQSISKLTEPYTRGHESEVADEFCRNTQNVEEMCLLDMIDRNNDDVKLQLASSEEFFVDADLNARSNGGEGEQTLFYVDPASAKFLKECDSAYDKPLDIGKAEDGALVNHFGYEELSDGRKQSLSNLDFPYEVHSEGALGSSMENITLDRTYDDDNHAGVKEETAIVANDTSIQNLHNVEEKNKYSKRDSTTSSVFPSGSISSCQDTVCGLAGEEEISDILNDMHISSAKKHMIASRISCTPKRNQSSKEFLQIENMKENTPHSKMLHVTNTIVEKSTILTSKRRALADLQNRIHRE